MNTVFKNNSQYLNESINDGRPCELIRVLASPRDTTLIDPEAMPQFEIRFTDTGELHSAYPDEIPEQDWLPEMKACLEGLDNLPPSNDCLIEYWNYGAMLRGYR
ncbi:hypothetical protein [Vibrio harveyi]|uniref:hypothetical protein n=1 Tax=Vibrio harveyi TaxID=669 RepID=UPI003CF65581